MNDNIYGLHNNTLNKILNEKNHPLIFKRWITEIPFAFLYKDDEKYKFVFMDLEPMQDNLDNSIWIEKKKII